MCAPGAAGARRSSLRRRRNCEQRLRHEPLEGIVSKRADNPYRPGARTGEWVKVKCRKREEFVVAGDSVGTKRHMTLLLGAWRDGRLIHLGRVRSGISEAVERDLVSRLGAAPRNLSVRQGGRSGGEARGGVGGRRWSRQLIAPAGPAMAACVRRRSRASGNSLPPSEAAMSARHLQALLE
jgi:hypothetical protein